MMDSQKAGDNLKRVMKKTDDGEEREWC